MRTILFQIRFRGKKGAAQSVVERRRQVRIPNEQAAAAGVKRAYVYRWNTRGRTCGAAFPRRGRFEKLSTA